MSQRRGVINITVDIICDLCIKLIVINYHA